MNIAPEEILLVTKGTISQTCSPNFVAVKIQILRNEDEFRLRISTDSPQKSDLLVLIKTADITLLKHIDAKSIQFNIRNDANEEQICLRFNNTSGKDTFFLLMKNVREEQKSREPANIPAAMIASSVVAKGPEARATDIESVLEDLVEAVANGDSTKATEAILVLSKIKAKLSITVEEIGNLPGSRSKFCLDVCVEDLHSSGTIITLENVFPNMTIANLKKMVFMQYNFPLEVQRWIVGRRIIKDTETLVENRINSSSCVFLYLISAEKAGITKDGVELQRLIMQQQPMLDPTLLPGPGLLREPPVPPRIKDNSSLLKQSVPDHQIARTQSAAPQIPPKKPTAAEVGWHCSICTLINPPRVPGCRACTEGRPADYKIPELNSYIMDEDEKKQHELAQLQKDQEEHVEQASRAANYQCLLQTDNVAIVSNREQFQCRICFDEVVVGDGVMLRECLHSFCKNCLRNHIMYSTDPIVMCPFNSPSYSCPERLLDREIKALVSTREFVAYLERGLSVAENQAANSFHCKTPDCRGFCFYDDNINFFVCPICSKENCLTCKAVHQGMNCKEYQDDLLRRSANDQAAKMTKSALEKMIQCGEAMKCPQCGIIMVKKEGCDWIKCSMCKLEVCWVTKGPRWGPGGEGGITGGCKCRVQGRKCHKNCQNCH